MALGKPAVPSLIRTLQNSKEDHVRWEAAKTLGAIGDIQINTRVGETHLKTATPT